MKSLFISLILFTSSSLFSIEHNTVLEHLQARIWQSEDAWDDAVADDSTNRMYYHIGQWEAFTEIRDFIEQSSTPD